MWEYQRAVRLAVKLVARWVDSSAVSMDENLVALKAGMMAAKMAAYLVDDSVPNLAVG